jgi:hypothetical protein
VKVEAAMVTVVARIVGIVRIVGIALDHGCCYHVRIIRVRTPDSDNSPSIVQVPITIAFVRAGSNDDLVPVTGR